MNSPSLEKLRVLTQKLHSKDDELILLTLFFELSLDMLCIMDKDGNFKRVSQSWERVLGWSRDELNNIVDLVHPEDKQSTLDAFGNLLTIGELFYFRNRCRCQDGSYKILCWTGITNPLGVFMIARDYTSMIERITE